MFVGNNNNLVGDRSWWGWGTGVVRHLRSFLINSPEITSQASRIFSDLRRALCQFRAVQGAANPHIAGVAQPLLAPASQTQTMGPSVATIPEDPPTTACVMHVVGVPLVNPEGDLQRRRDFESVTRHLQRDDPRFQELFVDDCGNLGSRTEEIRNLHIQLNAADNSNVAHIWKSIISHYVRSGEIDNLAKDGFKAFRDGHITKEQFCTLALCWSFIKDFSAEAVEVLPLFDSNGEVSQKASQEIKMRLGKFLHIFMINELKGLDNNIYLDDVVDTLFDRIVSKMRGKHPSEQMIFHIDKKSALRCPSSRTAQDSVKGQSIGDRLSDFHEIFGTNFPVQLGKLDCSLAIPSSSMMQAYLDAFSSYFKNDGVVIDFVIGLSTRADLANNARERSRGFFISIAGIETPKFADGFPVRNYFEFLLHDLYHCFIASTVPMRYRIITADIANGVSKLKKSYENRQNPLEELYLDTLEGCLVDMEFLMFRRSENQIYNNDQEDFLIELQDQISGNVLIRMWAKMKLQPLPGERAYLSQSELDKLKKWDTIRPPETGGHRLFEENIKNLFQTSPIFQQLAEAVEQDGFFTKFDFSCVRINDVRQYLKMFKTRKWEQGCDSPNACLITHLDSIYRKRFPEGKKRE